MVLMQTGCRFIASKIHQALLIIFIIVLIHTRVLISP